MFQFETSEDDRFIQNYDLVKEIAMCLLHD